MGIRWKLLVVVALPLVALLGLMAALDSARLRDEAVESARAALIDAAERHASILDVRLGAVAHSAATLGTILESDGGLSETEVYELLRRTVEADGAVFSATVAFQPGALVRPRGGVGGTLPTLPLPTEVAARVPAAGEFAPTVVRASGVPLFQGEPAPGAPRPPRLRGASLARLDAATLHDYVRDAAFARARDGAGTGAAEPAWWQAASRPVWWPGASAAQSPLAAYSMPWTRAGRFGGIVRIDVETRVLAEEVCRAAGAQAGTGVEISVGAHRVWPPGGAHGGQEGGERSEQAAVRGAAWEPGLGGGQRLIARAPARAAGGAAWSVACTRDRSDILRPVREALAKRLTDGLVFIGAAVVAVVGFSTWLVRPLRRLARAARRAGHASTGSASAAAAPSEGDPEQRVARDMQASLLPTVFPADPRWAVHAVGEPAAIVGGDFFDAFSLPDGRLVIAVADVAGKGVRAAMLMAVTRTLIRDLASGGAGPGATLERANTVLMDSNPDSLFVSVLLGVYDPGRGALRYANAGHPRGLVVPRGAGAAVPVAGATGTVLGALAEARWGEGTVELLPGDRLVLFTDGVSEARNSAGAFLGEAGIARAVVMAGDAGPEGVCRAVCAAARAHQGGGAADDATVLTLERKG